MLEREPAGASRPLYFTVARRSTAYHHGLVVEVTTDAGDFWIGIFDGAWSGKPVTGVFATPAQDRLMVVSEGAGYLVPVATPMQWEAVAVFPVTDVRRVPGQALVLAAGLQDLAAYGAGGLQWRVERLGFEAVTLIEVGEASAAGTAFDAAQRPQPFEVDLATGAIRRGPPEARTIRAAAGSG